MQLEVIQEFMIQLFVLNNPQPLPLLIRNGNALVASFEKFSINQQEVFLQIEQPEIPTNYPINRECSVKPEFGSIGQNYNELIFKIGQLAPENLPDTRNRQVVSRYYPNDLFKITNKQEAIRAIKNFMESRQEKL